MYTKPQLPRLPFKLRNAIMLKGSLWFPNQRIIMLCFFRIADRGWTTNIESLLVYQWASFSFEF